MVKKGILALLLMLTAQTVQAQQVTLEDFTNGYVVGRLQNAFVRFAYELKVGETFADLELRYQMNRTVTPKGDCKGELVSFEEQILKLVFVCQSRPGENLDLEMNLRGLEAKDLPRDSIVTIRSSLAGDSTYQVSLRKQANPLFPAFTNFGYQF